MKKKIFVMTVIVAMAVVLGIGSAVTSAFAYDTTIEEWGVEYFEKNTTGLYWYVKKDGAIPTTEYKADPTKPTIIYTHGWKPYESMVREGLSVKSRTEGALTAHGYSDFKYDTEFYNYYLEKGYNVGIFYWNQLADEGMNLSVVTKIWSSDNGENMKYVTYSENGTRSSTKADDETNPKESISMMYGKAIIEALGADFSGMLHLAGHSMGGELTCAVSEYLCLLYDKGEIGENLLPDRLTMIDPYIPDTRVTGIIDTTGKRVKNKMVAELTAEATNTIHAHGIPIEAFGANDGMCFRYYGSYMSVNNVDKKDREAHLKKIEEITETLTRNCAWVYLEALREYGGFDPVHVMAIDYYFTSNNFEAAYLKDGTPIPGPAITIEELQKIIGMAFIQKCDSASGKNPLYANESTFGLCNFATLEEYKTTDDTGRIYGKINVEHRENKALEVKLYDAEGELVAEKEVDNTGLYYFDKLAEGEYTLKVFADYIDVDKDIKVTVSDKDNSIGVKAEDVTITMGGDKILFIAVIVLAAIIVVVCISAIVGAAVKSSKNKKSKKHVVEE